MKSRRILLHAFLGLMLVFSMVRCVSSPANMGEVMSQPRGGNEVTIQNLQENWQNYEVYWNGGPTDAQAVAILFDPKADDLTLAVDKFWSKIDDEKKLSDVVGWMKADANMQIPHVMRVMGPNKQVFGYIYTFNESVPMHVINDKKMFVDAIVN